MRPIQKGPGNDSAIIWANYPDVNLRANGAINSRMLGQEYDGLESGELAWILGRRYITSNVPGGESLSSLGVAGASYTTGAGFGPDRMQRLAYTAWMEGFFRATFGSRVINLATLGITGTQNEMLSSEIKKYAPYLSGCSVLGSADLPHVINDLLESADLTRRGKTLRYGSKENGLPGPGTPVVEVRGTAEQDGLASGLFVMEKGPFLRGKIVEDMPVEMVDGELKSMQMGHDIKHTVPRNLGDTMAFEGLYSYMASESFFDWSPDGMVLSKLESPSGEPLSSAELDARQAQLFNVAIQGPALAKTWTGDPKMQCMPMDRVFVVMVADVVTTLDLTDNKKGIGSSKDDGANEATRVAWQTYAKASGPAQKKAAYEKYDALKKESDAVTTGGKTDSTDGAKAYADALKDLFATTKTASTPRPDPSKDKAAYDRHPQTISENARLALDAFYTPTDGVDVVTWEDAATKLKQGSGGAKSSIMTNFRLMKCTSSFLAQYSAYKPGDGASRCGLRLGVANANGTKSADGKVGDDSTVAAEYIIGGWCIGTVIDSAASRSTVGHLVRIAPASMAINISVNIEWWSGDKLYKHYMDVDHTIQRRGEISRNDEVKAVRNAMSDVGLADMAEKTAWMGESPAIRK